MQSITLSSDLQIPQLGLGTWQLTGEMCTQAVLKALELGYRHIDTAWIYDNQESIGKALQENTIDRKELFITSKVWRDQLQHDAVLSQCQETLASLKTDYLDLYLIHWPNNSIPLSETIRALNKLVDDGKIKNIGVSNFNIENCKTAVELSKHPITVNQVEYHPYLNQESLRTFCKDQNIVITAYSPLARGHVLTDSTIQEIAQKTGKSPCQVTLRWLIQKGLIVIPKASSEPHIRENLDVFDWELSSVDVEKINSLNKDSREVNPGFSEF
tara:strand:- start:1220 stop:2032 length:813 start_codon:yes stop_codon:yes gene_type:complete